MDDKIVISLTKKQRDLLLKYEPFFADHELFRLVSVAILKGKNYEIYLDEVQVEDLIDQVCELCNHEENEKLQDALDDLCDYLATFSGLFDEEEDFSNYSSNTGAVYTLKVALEGAPKIWRKIAIRGGQTLEDLHRTIFVAFNRFDEHLYSYYIPTKPLKSRPRRLRDVSIEYTHPFNLEERGLNDDRRYNAAMTTIESLKLAENQQFYYLFDFGDEWWHIITLEGKSDKADNKKYPRIVEKAGKSPAQYEYPEDEEDE